MKRQENRRFKVRGCDKTGPEIERVGTRLLLNVAPKHWPFPRFEWHERSNLVRIDGNNSIEPQDVRS
jgi:hypothetical protein